MSSGNTLSSTLPTSQLTQPSHGRRASRSREWPRQRALQLYALSYSSPCVSATCSDWLLSNVSL